MHDRLAALGAELLREALPRYLAGELEPQPQPEEGVTYAPTLKKEDGRIDWLQAAVEIDRHVRAYTPWPGTFTHWEGRLLKILQGSPLDESPTPDRPGLLIMVGGFPVVQTGQGLYRLDSVQLEGKQVVTGQEFLNGYRDAVGAVLRSPGG